MQIEVRIKDKGKWRGPTSEEFTGSLDWRVAYLSKLETVIKITQGEQEVILATGTWVDHYKGVGKVSIDLVELSKSLEVHPTIDHALKVLGGQIMTQGTLDI